MWYLQSIGPGMCSGTPAEIACCILSGEAGWLGGSTGSAEVQDDLGPRSQHLLEDPLGFHTITGNKLIYSDCMDSTGIFWWLRLKKGHIMYIVKHLVPNMHLFSREMSGLEMSIYW